MGLWTFLHVPAHMITVGDFQSDWRKCNPIKSSKVNGDGKKHRSVPEVFVAASPLVPSANTENSHRTREKPLVPRVDSGPNMQRANAESVPCPWLKLDHTSHGNLLCL